MKPRSSRVFSAERPILGNHATRATRLTGSFCLNLTFATICPFGQLQVVPGSGAAPGLPPASLVRTRQTCRHKTRADIGAVQQQHRKGPAIAVALRPDGQFGRSGRGDHAGQHSPGHLSRLRFARAAGREDLRGVEADKTDTLAPPGHRIAVDNPQVGRRDGLGRHPGLQASIAARQEEKGQQGCPKTESSVESGTDRGLVNPGGQPPDPHPRSPRYDPEAFTDCDTKLPLRGADPILWIVAQPRPDLNLRKRDICRDQRRRDMKSCNGCCASP